VLLEWTETAPADGTRAYSIVLPPVLDDASWVFLEPEVQIRNRWDAQPMRVLRPQAGETSSELTLAFPELKPGDPTRVTVLGRAVPELAARDVVTGPLTLPAGAELRFAIGVEEAAWRADLAPLEFSVAALDGGAETVLFRHRLDPAHATEDRRWLAARVDLGALAGRSVRLRLAARPADGNPGRTSLPVWGDPAVLAPRASARPNVLLVSLDTMRAASMSAYGAARATTPGLETEMVARGALFAQAIAPFPHTLPSHMSLFTSLYWHTHGVRGFMDTLGAERSTLPEVLRAAGYETAAFTEDGFLIPQSGFRRGFALYVENKSPDLHNPSGQIADTFARGERWLDEHTTQPFFLFLHTYQVHQPYVPPPAYRRYFGDAAAITDDAERDRLLYEQEIRYADDEVRALLQHVERLGLTRRTLVVVLADHGEEFMEHGQRYHGYQLYDEVLHVPLLLRLPDVIPAGLRVPAPVSLIDVAPTVLELLGLPPLAGAEGVSLVPLLHDPAAPLPRAAVFAEAPSSYTSGSVDLTAARSATQKCILRGLTGEHECFDLAADPGERHALAMDGASPGLGALAALLDGFRNGTAIVPASGAAPAPDAATEEKLRALGYVK
jgi:arylsulfatase A-like enzyme